MAAAPPVPVRAIVRRFWPYARPYRAALLVVLGLAALAPVIDAATVWMFKVVVDDVLVPRDAGLFVWVAAAYLGLVLLDGVVSFADDYLLTSVSERFLLRLRTDVFRHLHRLSPSFHDRRRLGDTMSRVTSDVAAIEGFVLSGVVDAPLGGRAAARSSGRCCSCCRGGSALAALVVAPLFWLASRYFSRLMRAASRERRRVSGSLGRAGRGEPVERLAGAGLRGRRPRGRALRPPGPPGHARRAHRDAHPAACSPRSST